MIIIKRMGLTKFFLSRDGDIIKQVYNKLYQEDSTEYALVEKSGYKANGRG